MGVMTCCVKIQFHTAAAKTSYANFKYLKPRLYSGFYCSSERYARYTASNQNQFIDLQTFTLITVPIIRGWTKSPSQSSEVGLNHLPEKIVY